MASIELGKRNSWSLGRKKLSRFTSPEKPGARAQGREAEDPTPDNLYGGLQSSWEV